MRIQNLFALTSNISTPTKKLYTKVKRLNRMQDLQIHVIETRLNIVLIETFDNALKE